MCRLVCQGELPGRRVPRSGLDHVELHYIPPAPRPRASDRRGAAHQQETQLARVAPAKEKERFC